MSLILEALRKSEAERRRGQAPGLFVEQLPVMALRRARTPPWAWALGGLLLVVLAAGAWRGFGRGLPGAGDVVAEQSPKPGAVADTASRASEPVHETVAATPAVTPPVNTGSVAPAAIVPPVATAPADSPTAAPAPIAATNDLPSTKAPPEERLATVPVETAPTPAPTPARPESSGPTPPVAGPATTPAENTPAEETVPRLAELPASDRAQLPPLKLSMHVYAEDPAQRFVILDGKRLQEGASPAAGVVLERIRRDGLVLSVNGRRVLLARP